MVLSPLPTPRMAALKLAFLTISVNLMKGSSRNLSGAYTICSHALEVFTPGCRSHLVILFQAAAPTNWMAPSPVKGSTGVCLMTLWQHVGIGTGSHCDPMPIMKVLSLG
jgi:hypothetical protein